MEVAKRLSEHGASSRGNLPERALPRRKDWARVLPAKTEQYKYSILAPIGFHFPIKNLNAMTRKF